MAKVTFNKYHNKFEVYFHKRGKKHVGYYMFYTTAQAVADGVNKAMDQV